MNKYTHFTPEYTTFSNLQKFASSSWLSIESDSSAKGSQSKRRKKSNCSEFSSSVSNFTCTPVTQHTLCVLWSIEIQLELHTPSEVTFCCASFETKVTCTRTYFIGGQITVNVNEPHCLCQK